MADIRVKINSLTLEDALAFDSSFELQRSLAAGSASRRSTLDKILQASQKWKGIYDVREAGIIGDGSDETAKLNLAYTQAYADNRYVWIPPRFKIGISAKINAKTPTLGGGEIFGQKPNGHASIVNIGINDIYTPMLEADTLVTPELKQFFTIKGVRLEGRNSWSGSLRCSGFNVVSGRVIPGDFTSEIRCLTFYLLDSFAISYCYGFGARVGGFIGMVRNCDMYYNGINRFMISNAVNFEGGQFVSADSLSTGTGTMLGVNSWALQLIASDDRAIISGEGVGGVRLSGVSIESGAVCNGLAVGEGIANLHMDTVRFEGFQGDPSSICYSVDIGSLGRSENSVSSTYALVAATGLQSDAVQGVTLTNCPLSSGASYKDLGARVRFNNIDRLYFVGQNSATTKGIEFTDKCRNVRGLPTGTAIQSSAYYARDGWTIDRSLRMGRRASNVIVNPNGAGGVRGWKDFVDNTSGRVSLSEDLSRTRGAASSLKVSHNGSTVPSLNYASEYVKLVPFGLAERNLSGKRLSLTGWMYIPGIADYSAQTLGPAIGIYYEEDTSNGGNTWVVRNNHLYDTQYSYLASAVWNAVLFATPYAWHLLRVWAELPTNPIRNVAIIVYPIYTNANAVQPTASHYINLEGLALCVDSPSIEAQAEGLWDFDELSGAVLAGGAIQTFGTGPPTNPNIFSKRGDQVLSTVPQIDQPLGWVAVADGVSGGSYQPYGLILASVVAPPTPLPGQGVNNYVLDSSSGSNDNILLDNGVDVLLLDN